MAPDYPTTELEVKRLVDGTPQDEVVQWFAERAVDEDPKALDALRAVLTWRADNTYGKHDIPRLAAASLLNHGPEGVEILKDMVARAPGAIYPRAILEVLLGAGKGEADLLGQLVLPPAPGTGGPLTGPVDEDTQRAAREAVADLLAESLVDDDRLRDVVGVIETLMIAGEESTAREVLAQVTEASIRLTPTLIEQFEAMIEEERREEDYQTFLAENPVFLDPLAADVLPKQRFGLEHISDFAIRRHDMRWLLVEIEKPQDRIVTRGNDFTREFVHGFGQVLDFQRWVEANAAYARRLMAGIASPRGLLIIGRRRDLDDAAAEKLLRFRSNSATIEVLTYDDVAANARLLYKSLHHGGPWRSFARGGNRPD